MIYPVPSFEDERRAELFLHEASIAYETDIIAGRPAGDSKTALMSAMEHLNQIRFSREQAALKEVIRSV